MSFKPEDTTIKDILYANINYIIPNKIVRVVNLC